MGRILLVLFSTLIFGLAIAVNIDSDDTPELLEEKKEISTEKIPVEKGKALGLRRIVLQSPNVTEWGEWGEWDTCLPGMYVHRMRLKTEKYRGPFVDDTGLNGIRLFCSPTPKVQDYDYKIESEVGSRGLWGNITSCPGTVAIGFQLRSERNQGSTGDDSAATNLRLLCDTPVLDYVTYVEGDGRELGDWTMEQKCPINHAICGLQTQVENSGNTADATGLNNVRMECCLFKRRL